MLNGLELLKDFWIGLGQEEKDKKAEWFEIFGVFGECDEQIEIFKIETEALGLLMKHEKI